MADDLQQPLPQPQQQQQPPPQQQQQQQLPPKPRLNLHEIRNSDLVSRLLAATPPYLYSSPVGPHNFFFSEMLRSLVQARNNDTSTNRSLNVPSSGSMQSSATHPGRRPRKRAWSTQRTPMFEPGTKEYKMNATDKLLPPEKPLELTTKIPHFQIPKYQKCNSPGHNRPPPQHLESNATIKSTASLDQLESKSMSDFTMPDHTPIGHSALSPEDSSPPLATVIPQSDLVLPPPPPMWYPPLYPPYGIDPLHFFIDLRVSGHIYDRKKENISPTANDNNNGAAAIGALDMETSTIGKHRHGSAFSVPPPRREKSPLALNLTSSSSPDLKTINSYNHTYDHTSSLSAGKLDCLSKNTNYVLQNLPRIYTHLSTQSMTAVEEPTNSHDSEDVDCKSDFDMQQDVDKDDCIAADDDSNDVVIVDSGKNSKNY